MAHDVKKNGLFQANSRHGKMLLVLWASSRADKIIQGLLNGLDILPWSANKFVNLAKVSD
jgi:hypothetical protein